jgi:hypothetical protein
LETVSLWCTFLTFFLGLVAYTDGLSAGGLTAVSLVVFGANIGLLVGAVWCLVAIHRKQQRMAKAGLQADDYNAYQSFRLKKTKKKGLKKGGVAKYAVTPVEAADGEPAASKSPSRSRVATKIAFGDPVTGEMVTGTEEKQHGDPPDLNSGRDSLLPGSPVGVGGDTLFPIDPQTPSTDPNKDTSLSVRVPATPASPFAASAPQPVSNIDDVPTIHLPTAGAAAKGTPKTDQKSKRRSATKRKTAATSSRRKTKSKTVPGPTTPKPEAEEPVPPAVKGPEK